MSHVRITKVFRYNETFDADQTQDPALSAAKDQIFRDFKAYLLTDGHHNWLPQTQFGRDELYDHPNTAASVKQACLRHVHIVPVAVIERVRRKYDATSDVHLVYCIDDVKGYACALALIEPGHDMAKDPGFLTHLAQIAEEFYSR